MKWRAQKAMHSDIIRWDEQMPQAKQQQQQF